MCPAETQPDQGERLKVVVREGRPQAQGGARLVLQEVDGFTWGDGVPDQVLLTVGGAVADLVIDGAAAAILSAWRKVTEASGLPTLLRSLVWTTVSPAKPGWNAGYRSDKPKKSRRMRPGTASPSSLH